MNAVRLRLRISLAILLVVLVAGTITFVFAEGYGFFDSLYFSIVTMATVGYGDITPKTIAGRIVALVMIVGGVSTFMGVLANATELYMEKREEDTRRLKINMISGLFFSEIGEGLLSYFLSHDANRDELTAGLTLTASSADRDFRSARRLAAAHVSAITVDEHDLAPMDELLDRKKDFLLRLLENPTLIEHGRFTEIIRATFHLREELAARRGISPLPGTDLLHVAGDMDRVYRLMLPLWINYMEHLKSNYPYLYSFALRMNPLQKEHNPVIG